MNRRGRGDRAVRVVRRDRDLVRLGHRGDLARLPESAAVREIGLDDVAGASRDQLAELVLANQALAGGDRDVRLAGDLRVASMSSVGQGSSKKSSPYGSSAWQYSIAHRGLGSGVQIDHQVHVVADRLADRFDVAGRLLDLLHALDRLGAREPP